MFDVREHTILLTIAGSRAYGIHTAASDVDVKGVGIPPRAYILGFINRFEQADNVSHIAPFLQDLRPEEKEVVAQSKLEGVVYELRKFMELASQANPNILDVLFCRDAEIRRITPLGERLRENASLFLSAKARHTFSGYATAQLKRIETHRRWLLSPPSHAPSRAEFDLPDRAPLPPDQLSAAEAAIRKQIDAWDIHYGQLDDATRIDIQSRIARTLAEIKINADERFIASGRAIGYDENFLVLLDRERRYKNARNNWEQYNTWKTQRNVDRAALEAKYGYDVKHGAHLYRLMKMCREIMETGKVNVWRGDIDAELIQGIRRGEWSYDQLVSWAKAEDEALTVIYEKRAYVLPYQPDRNKLDQLCISLMEDALRA